MSDYIEGEELLRMLQNDAQRQTITVVDVRDEDRELGWIPGSVNLPSCELTDEQLVKLVQTHTTTSLFVFHCMFSQQRGPRARAMFESLAIAKPRSVILRGGYGTWRQAIGVKNPQWVERDPEIARLARGEEE